jgi:hypothetical protein
MSGIPKLDIRDCRLNCQKFYPVDIISPWFSMLTWEMNDRPFAGRSSETYSRRIDMIMIIFMSVFDSACRPEQLFT